MALPPTETFWTKHGAFAMELGARIILIVLYSLFLLNLGQRFLSTPEASLAMMFLKEFITLALIVVRQPAKSFTVRPFDWAVAFFCTLVPTLIRAHPGEIDHLLPLGVQLLGLGVASIGLLSLNRSFGVIPANRGVKTGGLYRLVRHPVYLGYLLSYAGFICNHLTLTNAAILAAFALATMVRIRAEERHLMLSPEYAAFALTTRWRLIPLVW